MKFRAALQLASRGIKQNGSLLQEKREEITSVMLVSIGYLR
ncbi:hypothetical protein VULLAG_LOCUS17390 [Vulpes lagopus]